MFDLEKSINEWLRQFRKHRAFDQGEIREMELHLRDHIEDLTKEGLSEKKAFDLAVEEFGEITAMAEEEFHNIKTKTTFKSMLFTAMIKNYFKTSLRSLLRNPMTSFINIFGLSVAIGICVTTYAFVEFDVRTDRFHVNKDEVYLTTYYVDREGALEHYGTTPSPLGAMLKEDLAQVKAICRLNDRNVIVKFEENVFQENIRYVDSNFLELFTFPLKWGSAITLYDVNSIILSEEMSIKYFGDENPIGKDVHLKFDEGKSKTFKVSGVSEKFPDSHIIAFDFLINFENFRISEPNNYLEDWNNSVSATLIQVKDPLDLNHIENRMEKYKLLQNEVQSDWTIDSFEFMSLHDLHLSAGDLRNGISYDYSSEGRDVLPIVALFMLLLACFNYINIAIVSSAKRLKEIGLRKVMGANKPLVVFQFLWENILMTTFATGVGLVFALLVAMPWLSEVSGTQLTLDILDAYLWLCLIAILLFTAIVSGLYPAFYIARFQAVSIFKGSVQFGKKNMLTKIFLGFQLVLACTGITGAIIFSANTTYQNNRSWGFNQKELLYVEAQSEEGIERLRIEMVKNPNIVSSSASSHHLGRDRAKAIIHFPERQYEVDQFSVDTDYFETLELKLKEGRFFQKNNESDLRTVIVNEQLVKKLEIEQPIGQVFKMDNERYQIIGVLNDFQVTSFYHEIKPTMFSVSNPAEHRYLSMKVRKGTEAETYEALQSKWLELFPETPFIGGHQEDIWHWFYEQVDTQETFFNALAFIAVLLASLGVYGLVSLNVAGRIREFSVRKALGAGWQDIALSVMKHYIALTVISLTVGAPVSYYLVKANVDMLYADPVPTSYFQVALAAAILILVLIVVIATQIRQVLKFNPVDGLKVE